MFLSLEKNHGATLAFLPKDNFTPARCWSLVAVCNCQHLTQNCKIFFNAFIRFDGF